jgi:hypothetical protein
VGPRYRLSLTTVAQALGSPVAPSFFAIRTRRRSRSLSDWPARVGRFATAAKRHNGLVFKVPLERRSVKLRFVCCPWAAELPGPRSPSGALVTRTSRSGALGPRWACSGVWLYTTAHYSERCNSFLTASCGLVCAAGCLAPFLGSGEQERTAGRCRAARCYNTRPDRVHVDPDSPTPTHCARSQPAGFGRERSLVDRSAQDGFTTSLSSNFRLTSDKHYYS